MSVIELKEVKKTFPLGDKTIEVLKGISFSIEKGEMFGIMGPSGSGKSTTMNIIGLLSNLTGGSYTIAGTNASDLTSDQRATFRNEVIGFVFQAFFLLPRLSALENVCLPLFYSKKNMSTKESHERAMNLLEKVGLADRADHTPNELSGGQKQRVAIARALVCEPEIILADEPTGALDQESGKIVLELLHRLNEEDNATIIIVTHDALIGKECQRLVKVVDGKVIYDGVPE